MANDSRATVLLIDDDSDILETYELYLADTYTVRTATDGATGLEKLDATVEVVLLDRRMPGLSGAEILAEIRASDIDCRVVMVTGVAPDLDLLQMDFDEYLVKPVSEAEVREAVDRMLDRNELQADLRDMFAIASKLATLEAKLDIDQLESSEQYQALLDDFSAIRDDVEAAAAHDDYYSDATLEKIHALLDTAGD